MAPGRRHRCRRAPGGRGTARDGDGARRGRRAPTPHKIRRSRLAAALAAAARRAAASAAPPPTTARFAPAVALHSLSDPRDDFMTFAYAKPAAAARGRPAPAHERRGGRVDPAGRVVVRTSLFSLSDPGLDLLQGDYPRPGRRA